MKPRLISVFDTAKKSKNTGKGKQKAIPVEAIEEDDEESKDGRCRI